MKKSIFGLTYNQLETFFLKNNLNKKGANLIFNNFFKKLIFNFNIQNLSHDKQNLLSKNFNFDLPKVIFCKEEDSKANIKTRKFLLELNDGTKVESVLIPFNNKYTLCISSQVGCAMGCTFCFTGKQGFIRNLETYEIVGQLIAVKMWLKNNFFNYRISNIVFMGQGEPLHNFDAVKSACDIFTSQYGLSLGRDKITISTVGYLPGLKKWLKEPIGVNLALSFHCPDDAIRSKLIPLNKFYPLKEILSLISALPLEKKRFITFEILLIDNVNDSIEMAKMSGELLKDIKGIINIIPFNPIPTSPYQRPSPEKVSLYCEQIKKYGLPTMIRQTKGENILAACGQLHSTYSA